MSQRPQLLMHFNRFYTLPNDPLTDGVSVRRFQLGDEQVWAEILQNSGDLGEWNEERARRALTGKARVDASSIHFLMIDGKPVATACMQINEDQPQQAELGYVAVVPEYRGHGLGRTISMVVLDYINKQGFRACFLRTDDHRLAAIKTYLRLGFEPDMSHDSYPARWESLWRTLGYMPRRPWRLGIVGRRGRSTITACQALPDMEVTAYCDIDPQTLQQVADEHHIPHRFSSFEALLDSDVDAVVIATPMPLHVPQSVAALKAGKHVLSEVPAAVSLEECWELLEAVASSDQVYMMAENYCYLRPNVLVKELVRKGFLGEVYFGQGEYIHELKDLNEQTPWRRKWQTGRSGNTYPTHSLGPLMQWMNDRVVSVCCLGSGHHYIDPRGDRYENEDTTLTLCKLESGGLVQLRLDMLSERPHKMDFYTLQGTKGCYEAARGMQDEPKIWLADHSENREEWQPLSHFDDYLPAPWRNPPRAALEAGHGGGDYWEVSDFADALSGRKPPAIDVVTALEWTAAGLCSEISIGRGGAPVDLPDFRAAWKAKQLKGR